MYFSTWRRGALLALAVLLTMGGRPAAAQFVVYDPENHMSNLVQAGRLFTQVKQQVKEIQHARDQVNHLRKEAKGWQMRLSDYGRQVRQVRDRFRNGGKGIGYTNPLLASQFQKHFPEVPDYVNGVKIRSADQLNMVRKVAYDGLLAGRDQARQIDEARLAVSKLRKMAEGAKTDRKIQQTQAAVAAFSAEQELLTRHVLLAMTNQMSAQNARNMQKEMEDQVESSVRQKELEEDRELWREFMEEQRKRAVEEYRNTDDGGLTREKLNSGAGGSGRARRPVRRAPGDELPT